MLDQEVRGASGDGGRAERRPVGAGAAKKFDNTLEGMITLTAGLGRMGDAKQLAVTMNGGVAICIDSDPSRI
ncbi:hypothetical protein, partial [Saccharothrix sp. ST-888]|uniref:hypothetical protein n=1 Tax=Saccharothrix sp. ST-888 TaxID=1427391 RepID=UPI0005EC0494